MAQKTFFAVKDLDGDGKHYCAVAFESKLARFTTYIFDLACEAEAEMHPLFLEINQRP